MSFKLEFPQNALRRKGTCELGSLARLVLFKAGFNVNGIARIDAVSRTTEHVDEMRHEV